MSKLNPIDYLIYYGCCAVYKGCEWIYNKFVH